jgi:hypothetical protein
MLEGNIAPFLSDLTDDEFRLLLVFAKVELKLDNLHPGMLAFVSRDALCNKLERVFEDHVRGRHTWSKLYVEVRDILDVKLLKNIQRKLERRTYKVGHKPKKRKYSLTLYKDGQFYASYRCKTIHIARYRGSVWATGKGIKDVQGRDSAGSELAADGGRAVA